MLKNTFTAAFVTAASLLAATGSTLHAQPAGTVAVVPAGQTVWVVTADNLLARSGDAYSFYPVAALKTGTVLTADGERGGYIRVVYPAGTRAIVKADEAKLEGGRLKLIRPTTLQAFNQSAGIRASWNPLLDKPLPPGTELVLIEEIKDSSGVATHFAVEPPASARAYVDRQGLRRATDAEIAALTKPATPVPAPVAPAPALTATNTTTPPTVTSNAQPVPTNSMAQPATTTPPTPANVPAVAGGAPSTTPAATTTTTSAHTPEAVSASQPSIATEITATTVAPVPVAAAPVLEVRQPSREEQLMVLFNRLRATPVSQLSAAELSEAIEQFETYKIMQSADAASIGKVGRVDGYLQTLTLMRDVKAARDSAAGDDARWAQKRAELGREIAALEKQRVYQLIGLLVPSAIYDGVSLPKFYRIQSPEPGSFRTLGYIAPTAELGLDGKVGNVIGIMGGSQWDESLKAPLVTATRVDVVSLAAIIGSPQSASEILGTSVPGALPPAQPASQVQPTAPPAPVNTPGPFEIRMEPTPTPPPQAQPESVPATTNTAPAGESPAVTGTTVVKPIDMQKP